MSNPDGLGRVASFRVRGSKTVEDAVAKAGIKVKMMPTQFGARPAIEVDGDQMFLLFASFCGDVAKTAHASGVSKEDVVAMALANNWEERIRGLVELKKTDKAGEVERGINRAMNFVQVHRFRVYLEEIIREITSRDKADIFSMLIVDKLNKNGEVIGSTLTFKPLSDLAAALEKVHWMSYQALNDSPQERAARKPKNEDEDAARTDIHARIARALSDMRAADPKLCLEREQASMAAHIAATPSVVIPPLPTPAS